MFPFVDGVTINFAEIDAKVKVEQMAENALMEEYLSLPGRPTVSRQFFYMTAVGEASWSNVVDIEDWTAWRNARKS